MSLRQWLQGLLPGSQRKPSHAEPSNSTRTFNAPATPHEIKFTRSLPALTPREAEIVRLIRKGYSNKEIAHELGIAVTTVKWNMTNILAKFEVQSSKQLIALLAASTAADARKWTILE